MILKKNLHWLLYPLFVLACARQTTPTGGPKDTLPPVLIKSLPKHEEILVKGRILELTFSEMVQIVNPKEQLIIIPSIGKNYNAIARKDKIIITIEEELQDSTTYSINFRDAVQDITEKNPVKNLKLAFSTGDYIDSISIEGKVLDQLKQIEANEATVALYQQDTFNIFKHKPVYLTKTNKKGNFKIENLKNGNYFIYAMEDKNKNLLADSKSENYGFLRDTLYLNNNKKNIAIPTVRLDARELKLTSARPYNTYFNIKTSKNLASYRLKSNEGIPILSSFGEDNANIKVYNSIDKGDSLLINFQAIDSIDNKLDTSLYVKFNARDIKSETFQLSLEESKVTESTATLSATLKFNKPLLNINFDSIFYRIDSTKIVYIKPSDVKIDSMNNLLYINKTFDKALFTQEIRIRDSTTQANAKQNAKNNSKKNQNNEIVIANASFISIELDSSKAIVERVKPLKLEETSSIIVQIETDKPHFLVQLLDKNFTVAAMFKDIKNPVFEHLIPGDYLIRVVSDNNNNGKWDPGNYFIKKEPEFIVYYRNEKGQTNLNVKANWELGPLLIKL